MVRDTFGVPITYSPAGATSTFELTAIAEQPAQAEETAAGTYMLFFMRRADFPVAPANGDAIETDGLSYMVVRIEADQDGGVTILARQNG
ncbi:MAG TPA: hypothetical protein VMX97_08700 [Hyphomicrobiaceae bacterium]|nr:hypothetical protein [Hyphomicrobiaceae bacterium]